MKLWTCRFIIFMWLCQTSIRLDTLVCTYIYAHIDRRNDSMTLQKKLTSRSEICRLREHISTGRQQGGRKIGRTKIAGVSRVFSRVYSRHPCGFRGSKIYKFEDKIGCSSRKSWNFWCRISKFCLIQAKIAKIECTK